MSNILCPCPAAQNEHQKNPQKLGNTETDCAAVGRVTHTTQTRDIPIETTVGKEKSLKKLTG